MLDLLVSNMPLTLLAVGLILMALEAVSPGAHLIVIGVALVGAGLIGVLFPPAAAPLILAALVLAIGVAATWVYREFDFYGGKGTAQTSDSDSLSGTTGYVTETVTNRSGKVKLDDGGFNPYYSARTTSGPIEEGEEIIVIDPGGGNVLSVEPFGNIEADEIDRELAREAARKSADEERKSVDEEREGSEGDENSASQSSAQKDADRGSVEPATETEETG